MLKSDAKNCASDGKPVAQDADADAKTSKVVARRRRRFHRKVCVDNGDKW